MNDFVLGLFWTYFEIVNSNEKYNNNQTLYYSSNKRNIRKKNIKLKEIVVKYPDKTVRTVSFQVEFSSTRHYDSLFEHIILGSWELSENVKGYLAYRSILTISNKQILYISISVILEDSIIYVYTSISL